MDSLSQIVLGAAVGEVVLGKRLGNRAMVWGAVAGTLPDMDRVHPLDGRGSKKVAKYGLARARPVLPE